MHKTEFLKSNYKNWSIRV